MPIQTAPPYKVQTFLRKKEEAGKALKNISLEDALKDAPNLVRFLRKRFESIHITDIAIDDDPHSRLMTETVHLMLSKDKDDPYCDADWLTEAEYTRVIDEFGKVTVQDYSCEGDIIFSYCEGKRTDNHREIPFP
jgi:hypothetical protein